MSRYQPHANRVRILQEANAKGNALDMLTWRRSLEGDGISSSKYALSTSRWLSVVDKTKVKAVKPYVSEFPRSAISPARERP
jgi:hypothetical protein